MKLETLEIKVKLYKTLIKLGLASYSYTFSAYLRDIVNLKVAGWTI